MAENIFKFISSCSLNNFYQALQNKMEIFYKLRDYSGSKY